ncbi:MAG: hypothetical protein JSR99_05875 [Proteobacteria bacterium]|nr:hypothetical protein [Pseudomonadota bacterium]
MTAFFRPLTAAAAVIASLMAVSAANAMPVANPATGGVTSNLVKVHDRYDRDDYRYHHRYYRGRHVVHAPFTRVESGGRTVVDAPFAHVYDGPRGTHVVAPFVDLWR